MKINVSVDVEWLEEDGSMDEEVQLSIIQGVKNAISKNCLAKVEKKASQEINTAINNSINSAQELIENKAIAMADDWLTKEVTITDKWGDVVESVDVMTLIKKAYDKTLERSVDNNGKFSNGGYDKTRLIDWLVKSKVESVVQDKLKGINKDIDNQITKAVNAGIRENVSNKFAEMVVQTAKVDNKLRLDAN